MVPSTARRAYTRVVPPTISVCSLPSLDWSYNIVNFYQGQVYFPENILKQVDAADVYNGNTYTRLTNTKDSIFEQENTGYNAVAGNSYW